VPNTEGERCQEGRKGERSDTRCNISEPSSMCGALQDKRIGGYGDGGKKKDSELLFMHRVQFVGDG
jgi:hypothetical protein